MRQLTPGDHIAIRKRGRLYDARVLAVIGRESLVEYQTGSGLTSLVFGPARCGGVMETHRRNPYGYRKLPLLWLDAMLLAGQEWVGRSRSGPIGDVSVLRSRREAIHAV